MPKTPLQEALDEALYATNRVLQRIRDIQLMPMENWSERERDDFLKLEASRDHIWDIITILDPTRHD